MKGKLIVIDGSDASGKATQSERLYKRLYNEGKKVHKVEYPNYDSDSSALIKMYLNGDFGDNAKDVNSYTASTFYAVDRYASFKKEWEEFYKRGEIILADRYTTSNMVHQAAKFDNLDKREEYLNWLWDLEFNKYALPVPDSVIFLDMPPQKSRELMKDRRNKFTGEKEKDIHENDYEFLKRSYQTACWVAEKYNWHKISCVDGDRVRTIDEIHNQIMKVISL